jgi:Tfp pilus assembly protein PilX
MGGALTRLRSEEGGWAIVIAMALMTVMLASGMALAMTLDVEGKQSVTQRTRETAFNLAEASLHAQVRAVGYQWPGAANVAFPACTPTSADPLHRCPLDAQLQKLIPSVDTRNGITWQTEVHDNAGSFFYSDAVNRAMPGYDAENNGAGKPTGDGYVWVRAEATAGGRTRMMVGLVRITYQQEDILRAAVRTGRLTFSNPGRNKWFIDGQSGGYIQTRCEPTQGGPTCLGLSPPQGYVKDLNDLYDQFDGSWAQGTQRETIDLTNAMSRQAIEDQRRTAVQLGTYYNAQTGCPTSLWGKVVYIDHLNCQVAGGGTVNSQQGPGMIVVDGGSLSITGNTTIYGVIYYTDLLKYDDPATIIADPAIELSGTVALKGGLIVDGMANVKIGDSGAGGTGVAQITFDGRGFDAVQSIAAADVVQNTWRELTK